MTIPWTILDEKLQYDGYRKIIRRRYQFPDGREDVFDLTLDPEVVAILALTPEQRVLLAKQFRPGPSAVLYEVPGGRVETGEDPLAAARRELLEETGYEGDLHMVVETPYGAISTMRRYNFVALNCRKVGQPHPDSGEFIELMDVSLDEFRAILRSGMLTDVGTGYLGLDYLGLL
jgi:ADP-ribose pyrophosphatase